MLSPAPWLRGLMKRLPPAVNRTLFRAFKRVSFGWSEPVRELRCELGLPGGKDPIFDGQHSPHGILALFSSRLARAQPDWPANARICGFLFHDEDIDARAVDPRLEEFLSQGPPPVVFTFGSSAVRIAADLYRRAIRAASGLGLRAVILAGPHATRLRTEVADVKIFVAPSAPYHWLFPRCAATVHQAGIGTLAQAMRAGKPMLIIPFSHDQFDNARLAQESGIAGVIKSRGVRTEAIARQLEAILADSRMAHEARGAGEAIRGEEGLKIACDRIEELLSGG